MRRRESLAALICASAGSIAQQAAAQPPAAGRPFRIALVPDFIPAWEPMLKLFVQAMAELGRAEGRDYTLVRSGVFYAPDTQPAVDRAMEAKPDLLLTANLGYAVAAHRLTKTLPVVMWVSGFPVEGGVAQSLSRPGGNVTGLTVYAGGEVFGKLVQMVHEARPGIKRIGALMSYVPPFHPRAETDVIVDGMRSAAQPLGVDLRVYEVARTEQIDEALASAARQDVEAMVLTSDPVVFPRRTDIMRFAIARRWPTISDLRWDSAGDPQPMLVYEADYAALIRQAAPYVDKILWRGARPGDLPIQLPAKFVFTVNQKTARAIGLPLPQPLLVRADQVIE